MAPFVIPALPRLPPLLIHLVIGAAGVEVAIGTAFEAVLAAEVEVLAERIADRPLAGGFGQLQFSLNRDNACTYELSRRRAAEEQS